MSEEDENLKKALSEDEINFSDEGGKETEEKSGLLPEEALAQKVKEEKKLAKKKRNKRLIILGVVLFIAYVIHWGMQGGKSTIQYGICKTFLELNIVYPTTLHVNEVDVLRDGSYRLWATRTDPFGSRRLDPFQCSFAVDEKTGLPKLTKAKLGTIFIDDDKVKFFNYAIPYLVANPPDLSLPAPLTDRSINNLQFDTNSFTNIKNLADKLPL